MTELNELKRGRGRPKGASRLNGADSLTLSKIADLIVANPMQPTTAMRRLNIHGDADTRRLQRKWKRAGTQFIEAAHERRRRAMPSPMQSVAETGRRVQDMVNHIAPSMARLHDYMHSPAMLSLVERMRAFAESPQVRHMQELANRMEASHLRDLAASPLATHIREMEARAKQFQDMMETPTFQERFKQMEQMQSVVDHLSRGPMIWPADPVKRARR
jgi:hypothetical protein